MGTSQDKGYLFGGPSIKDYNVVGPMIWETTISVLGNKGSGIFGVEGDEAESPSAIVIPSSIPFVPLERHTVGHVILLHEPYSKLLASPLTTPRILPI